MSHDISSIKKLNKQPELDYDVTVGQQAQKFIFSTDCENMNFWACWPTVTSSSSSDCFLAFIYYWRHMIRHPVILPELSKWAVFGCNRRIWYYHLVLGRYIFVQSHRNFLCTCHLIHQSGESFHFGWIYLHLQIGHSLRVFSRLKMDSSRRWWQILMTSYWWHVLSRQRHFTDISLDQPLLANFRGMSWTDLWKTHPIVNFRILGPESVTQATAWHRPIFGKLIQNSK